MSKFTANKVINEPIESVFKSFMKVNKREFPKLPEKDPLGYKWSKVLKQKGNNSIKMKMEITEYKVDDMYQVTGTLAKDQYISTFKFIAEDDETTRVELVEEQIVKSFGSKIGLLLSGFSGNKKARNKLERVVDGIQDEIDYLKRKMERSKKKAK